MPYPTIKETQERLNIIRRTLKSLVAQFRHLLEVKSAQEQLYQQAILHIGYDASRFDLVNDDLGCAESVSTLLSKVVSFPIITGTWTLNNYLANSPLFKRTSESAGRGTIIISPTGTGNGKRRGHVGILGDNKSIMSANSLTGIWQENYTISSWYNQYRRTGGLPIFYYSLL